MASISVKKRTEKMLGKNTCKKLREKGEIPGVVYGLKKDPVSILISADNCKAILKERIIKLDIDNVSENVMIKEVQYNPFGEKLLHIDFLRIDLTKKINVSVPLLFIGTPKGLQQGGVFEKQINKLNIYCLPSNIPDKVAVPIENLEVGAIIRVKDINLTAYSASTDSDPELIVAAVKTRLEDKEAGAAAAALPGEEKVEPELIRKPKEKSEEPEE